LSERPNEQTIALPPALQRKVEDAQAAWHSKDNTRRLWSKDATLWTGGDEGNWLGWLDSIDSERRDVAPLQAHKGGSNSGVCFFRSRRNRQPICRYRAAR
jgi:transaldolase/glucose-6-phosphate isomerase